MARGTTHRESNLSCNGTLAVAGATSLASSLAVTGAATLASTLAVTGAVSLTVPLTVANANESVKRDIIHVHFGQGIALTDGATYVASIPFRRAGSVKAIAISAATRMVGGTNTLAIAKKNGGTSVTLLNAATIDPTAIPTAADTAEALTLTSTSADKSFVAGDTIKCTLVCGTMTTDGVGYSLSIEVEYTDV